MILLRLCFTLCMLTVVSACNSTYISSAEAPELLDSAFPNYHEQYIEPSDEIFAINDEMITFVEDVTANHSSNKNKLTALASAIFSRTSLALSYDAGANTTALQTFEQGAANCLSLTIMTYTMTQHMGMQSEFQDVAIPEFWTRRQGNTLINRHINLLVKPQPSLNGVTLRRPITIDFDPQQGVNQLDSKVLTKAQMISNFYANNGADYLIDGNGDSAYAYLKAALKADPQNYGAWLNLGVLFAQYEHFDVAQQYYQHALRIEPKFSSGYENLALLYKRQGKYIESEQIMERLRTKRESNPYYHMVLGDIAAERNKYSVAISYYKKAISLDRRPHAFHFSLAKVYSKTGDLKNARRALNKAKKRAEDDYTVEKYAIKLAYLTALRS